MSFWLALACGQALAWTATRRRRWDRWSRLFWGVLVGFGLWLAWLAWAVEGGGP